MPGSWGCPELYRPVREAPDHKDFDTLAAAQKAVDEHVAQLNADSLWSCTSSVHGVGCGSLNRVGDTVAIQSHYYIAPYSCTGGDYYLPGELYPICPKCSLRNRTHDAKPLAALKPHFKSIEKEYKD